MDLETTPGDLAPVQSLSPVPITLRRLLFTCKSPPALDAKRRCRCWAWLHWAEGGCTVRRFILQIRTSPCRFPAAGLLLGHRISPSWTPHPPAFRLPRGGPPMGESGARAVNGEAFRNVGQKQFSPRTPPAQTPDTPIRRFAQRLPLRGPLWRPGPGNKRTGGRGGRGGVMRCPRKKPRRGEAAGRGTNSRNAPADSTPSLAPKQPRPAPAPAFRVEGGG